MIFKTVILQRCSYRVLHYNIITILYRVEKNKMSACAPGNFSTIKHPPQRSLGCGGWERRIYPNYYYDDDIITFCIKLLFRFVTGLVHEATVGVGDIDRQYNVGADVFQTSDVLDAAPVVDGLDTSARPYAKIENKIYIYYIFSNKTNVVSIRRWQINVIARQH